MPAAMKQLLLLALLLLTACRTPDYTRNQPDRCPVHRVAMTKRVVPIAYGMIPMSQAAAAQGEWRRRMDFFPHPGDCLPATSINRHGERRARVFVCAGCAAAQRQDLVRTRAELTAEELQRRGQTPPSRTNR